MPEHHNPTGAVLHRARQQSGLSLRGAASRAGTSHATLSAYEKGTKSPTTDTFFRILHACGLSADIELRPRIREFNGLPRGEELAQVLRLAAEFPANPARRPRQPIFRKLSAADG